MWVAFANAKATEFRCVLPAPMYYMHQIFAQDFVKKMLFLCRTRITIPCIID